MENNNAPLVSIVIPVWNRSATLLRAVNSVKAQTCTDWEIIIVDDASIDDSKLLIEKLSVKSEKIFPVYHAENKGPTAARNTGILRARGMYIAFLDSDDEWLPEKLEKQLEAFKKGNTAKKELGLVYTGLYFINEKRGTSRVKCATIQGDLTQEALLDNPIGTPSRVMVLAEAIKKVGGFDESFASVEDVDLWMRIGNHYSIGCAREPLIRYYESDDSVSINAAALIGGYETLWKKYDLGSMSRDIRAAQYLRLGHRLCYYGASEKGRKYIWKALKTQPYVLKNCCLFLFSLLPSSIYQRIMSAIMNYQKNG